MGELRKPDEWESIQAYPVMIEEVHPSPLKPYIKVTLYFPMPENGCSRPFIQDKIRLHTQDGARTYVLVLNKEESCLPSSS